MSELPPVIAIDGPSASGKGTVAMGVAQALHWHYLDSGALYRLVALAARRSSVPLSDGVALGELAKSLNATFSSGNVILDNQIVNEEIRAEESARAASAVAVFPEVRSGLLARQRAYRLSPGLVADGRDMGSVVFPDAELKIYLTASPETRALRRHKQLKDKGIIATLDALLQDLNERDTRDRLRNIAPLQQGPDARLLDTTNLSIDESVSQVLEWHGQGHR